MYYTLKTGFEDFIKFVVKTANIFNKMMVIL